MQLRPHQQIALEALEANRRGQVIVPTGGGKTLIAIEDAKRQFTKEVPKHYWMQMQGQLESCDLEECDFLQVKISEYLSESPGSIKNPLISLSIISFTPPALAATVTHSDNKLSSTTPGKGSGVVDVCTEISE